MRKRFPEISDIGRMTRSELVAAWRQAFGKPPAIATSREFLAHELARRVQEQRCGGRARAVGRRLDALAASSASKSASRQTNAALQTRTRPRPGTTLVKQWRGKEHRVVALEAGFAYDGQTYRSLSEVARAITGTRWNGPAFFGLRKDTSRRQEASVNGR